MSCPKCRTHPMRPLRRASEGGPVSLQCSGCRGIWLTHEDLDRLGIDEHDQPTPAQLRKAEDRDRRTGLCPYDGTILVRARIPLEPKFYLDRCATCGGIFFDAGELQRVTAAAMLQGVYRFWDANVQRELDAAVFDEMYRERLVAAFGHDGIAAIEKAAEVVGKSPQLGMAYLIAKLGSD